ncbi:MAG: hypothetical protein GF310_04920, partial [candidate division Zixibacteria bacterium]|nr:hypothetical protein [candidate division Zixibacteria bacterium]
MKSGSPQGLPFIFDMIADVVIFNGPPKILSYRFDNADDISLQEGQRVVVPLGRRKAFG